MVKTYTAFGVPNEIERIRPGAPEYKNSMTFQFCNKDTTERISKALAHLIKLKGGKKQLF